MRTPPGFKEISGSQLVRYPLCDLTEKIIGAGIRVHRDLGPGFIESVYENAMCIELEIAGLAFERQKSVAIVYHQAVVGEHRADLLVEGQVVVELKAVSELTSQHRAQVMSTMKAFKAKVGLLMNFHEARLVDGIRRFIL